MSNLVNVVRRKVTGIHCDAVIVSINSTGFWFGGVTERIRESSGNIFHSQVEAEMPLREGQIIYVPAMVPHNGSFNGVIFVVDDQTKSVYSLTSEALETAARHQLSCITLPTLRSAGSRTLALAEIAMAIADFSKRKTSVEKIYVVANSDEDESFLADELYLI